MKNCEYISQSNGIHQILTAGEQYKHIFTILGKINIGNRRDIIN